MLQPKRTKYRKQFRGVMKGVSTAGSKPEFGEFALKATSQGWVSAQEIESARKAITRYTKKGGRSYIRIFPDKPISKKPPETRMGSEKAIFLNGSHRFAQVASCLKLEVFRRVMQKKP